MNFEELDNFHIVHDYDPVKRREYYLKNRQLKGRKIGRVKNDGSLGLGSFSMKKPKKNAAQKRKEAAARIKATLAKLERLKAALERLVDQAQKRSGADSSSDSKKSPSKSSEKSSSSKTTAKEKADSRERSKKYYQEHKDDPSFKKIKQLRDQIRALREQLKQEVADFESAKKSGKKPKMAGTELLGLSTTTIKRGSEDRQNGS